MVRTRFYDERDWVTWRDLLLVLTEAGVITEAQAEEVKARRSAETEAVYANLANKYDNLPRRRWRRFGRR